MHSNLSLSKHWPRIVLFLLTPLLPVQKATQSVVLSEMLPNKLGKRPYTFTSRIWIYEVLLTPIILLELALEVEWHSWLLCKSLPILMIISLTWISWNTSTHAITPRMTTIPIVTTLSPFVPLTTTSVLRSIWPFPLMTHTTLPLIILVLVLRSSLVAILATSTTSHWRFILSLRLSVSKIYLPTIDLSDSDLINQLTCHGFINVCNKTEAPTLSGNWIPHNLCFLHLPKLPKMHTKFTICQRIIKASNKDLISNSWFIILFADSRHSISRTTSVAHFILLCHPISVCHNDPFLLRRVVSAVIPSVVLSIPTPVVLLIHLHRSLLETTELLLARWHLIQERVRRLVTITFSNFNLPILDHMRCFRMQQRLL